MCYSSSMALVMFMVGPRLRKQPPIRTFFKSACQIPR